MLHSPIGSAAPGAKGWGHVGERRHLPSCQPRAPSAGEGGPELPPAGRFQMPTNLPM